MSFLETEADMISFLLTPMAVHQVFSFLTFGTAQEGVVSG